MTRDEALRLMDVNDEGYDTYRMNIHRIYDESESKVKLTSDECQLLAMYAKHHGQEAIYKKLCTMMYQDLRKVND